jgi:hypothetical protein
VAPGKALAFSLLFASTAFAADMLDWAGDLPADWTGEGNSPNELLPATVEPGLTSRAVPMLPPLPPPEPLMPLYRLQKMQNIQDVPLPSVPGDPDPASFRPATTYAPPTGLHPRVFRAGLLEFYPWFGLAQSFESNVQLTASDHIADFYITPRLGVEWQLGTPDSIYNEFYDMIVALNGHYEAWADLFYKNPDFSAFNQEVQVAGRIGRSAAIWRPSFGYSDVTGSNLLMAELVNRTQRIKTNANLLGEYQFTSQLGMNQTFGFFRLMHPDDGYINYAVGRTQQELTWKVLNQVKATAWAEYRYSEPDQGSSGSEFIGGIGFYGKPDPRLYTELRIGWDFVDMEGYVPGRRNMSGLRFNGWTTFDWSSRLRLTLRYDRDYVLNEVDVNDNYVSTLLQARGEIYLGGSWYVTPYFGCSLQEFETSGRIYLQIRPELEVAYALPGSYYPADSRVFVKAAYMNSSSLRGEDDPVENWRFSVGLNCKF